MKAFGVGAFFALIFCGFIYYLIVSGVQPAPIDEGSESRHARIELDQMTAVKYRESTPVQNLKADLVQFFEPNLIELFGNIDIKRFKSSGTESAKSQIAKAELNSRSTADLFTRTDSQLEKATIERQISLKIGEYTLQSELVHYSAQAGDVYSKEKVKVVGVDRSMEGIGGFKYNMNKGDLTLSGPVRGRVVQ
jgi:LPS export ABC transporter protein LptC